MLLLGTEARANELLKALEKNKSKTNVDRNKSNFDKDKIIAKEIILNCKVLEMLEYDNNNNLIKTYTRKQVVNPQMEDGYFHYNPNQKFIARLLDPAMGAPYGVALAIGGVLSLPHSALWRLAGSI